MKTKKYKMVFVLPLFVLILFVSCDANYGISYEFPKNDIDVILDNQVQTFGSISYEEVRYEDTNGIEYVSGCELTIDATEFITLPNGTMLDSRITKEIADVIIRHFDAIENGDLEAFWHTLMGEDGADMNYHTFLILRYFGDMVNVEPETQKEIFATGVIPVGLQETLFHPTHPSPRPRNTGLFVKEIKLTDFWFGIEATVINSEGEKTIYGIVTIRDFFERVFINRREEIFR